MEVVREIDPVAAGWDALADEIDAPPFLRPGWMSAWYGAFGRGELALLVARDGHSVRGVLPLEVRGGTVRALANWHSPEYGPVAADASTLAALAERAVQAAGRRLTLPFLPEGEAAHRSFAHAAAAAGHLVVERRLEQQPYVPLAGWEPPARVARDARRRRRRLEELGSVAVEVDEVEAGLEEGLALEPSGWKGRTAILADERVSRFYRAVALWARDRGWLRLAFLRLDGRAIAFQLALETPSTWYFLKGGYDAALSRCSPGKVLVHALLERSAAAGRSTFEFLGSAEPWKLEWTELTRGRIELRSFTPSLAGRAEWVAFAYARPVAKRIKVVDRAVLALRR